MLNRLRACDRSDILLLLVILLGLCLRGYGMNWDEGVYLHPDERFIAIVSSERVDLPTPGNLGSIFDPAHSPLNPRRDDVDGNPLSFAYGTLPVYVQSAVSWGVNLFSESDYQSYPLVYRVGRPLSVLMDMITLVTVYLLGRRLFGKPAGVVGAAFYALAVLPIQLSHFFTVDVWLTSFVTVALYLAIRYMDKPTTWRAVALGVPVGCAFATKASVPSLLLPLAIVALVTIWRASSRVTAAGRLAIAGLVALAVFTFFEPYAIVRMGPFIKDIRLQARIVRGQFDVPYTRQFIGLTPGLYELRNLFAYGLGPALVIAGVIGFVRSARECWRTRDLALLITLSWIAAYVPTLLITEARFLRYSQPLVPMFAVFAAGLLTASIVRLPTTVRRMALASALVVTALWAFGFMSIYAHENSRMAASKWMIGHIPAGKALTVETWDDGLPLPYPGAPPMPYTQIGFDLYSDKPPPEQVDYIAGILQQTDYVVLSSDRVIDSVDNEPWRYAVQIDYYRRLTAGQLGFQLVYEAAPHPGIFGLHLNDSRADESFTVYDHPHVRIYQKVQQLSQQEIRNRLLWGVSQTWYPTRYAPQKTLMLGEPVDEVQVTHDAEWNTLAVNHTAVGIVFWLLSVEILGLAVLPLVARVFARSPDRGALSTRLIGLLVVGWLGWVAGSLNLWSSRSVSIGITLAAVGGVTWGIWCWLRKHSAAPTLPSVRQWSGALTLWLVLFGFFLLLRAFNPDFWQTWFGGEKPFELAYLRAVTRSPSFPPYDPWYSGGVINYYYYGWHLIGTLIKLSGVGVSQGFQFGVASVSALFGMQVAGIGSLLISRAAQHLRRGTVVLAGLVTLIATQFIGNLDAFVQIASARGVHVNTFDFWRSTRVIDYTINEFPYFSAIWADLHPHVINLPIVALLLTLLCALILHGSAWSIREHRLTLGLLALVLGSISVTNSWDAPLAIALTIAALTYAGLLQSWRRGVIGATVGIGIALASFVLFFPFYRGFYSVVQGVNPADAGSPLREFLTVWGIFFGITTLALLRCTVENIRNQACRYDSLAMLPTVLLPGILAMASVFIWQGSLPDDEAIVALLLATFLCGAAGLAANPSSWPRGLLIPWLILVGATGLVAPWRPSATVALAITVIAAAQAIARRDRPGQFIPWAFIAIGSVTIAATEFVYVADDLQHSNWERMNTVFKFSLQAWTLLAVASAVLFVDLWRSMGWSPSGGRHTSVGIVAHAHSRSDEYVSTERTRSGRFQLLLASGATVLLAAGLLYPLLGTPARLSWQMPSSPTGLSLNGYAWMNGGEIQNATGETISFTGDLAAIRWLDEHATANDVILEASIGPYRGNGSRISSATGLPTVLGWDRHQRQQRYQGGIDARMRDVRAIYNATQVDQKLEDLRRYDVRYVVVGDVERYWNSADDPTPYASAAGLSAFDALVGHGLSLVFEAEHTRIYEVLDFERLPSAARSESGT